MELNIQPIYVEITESESLGVTVEVGRFVGENNHHIYTSRSLGASASEFTSVFAAINSATKELIERVETETAEYVKAQSEPVDYNISPIMQYFAFAHLPETLQRVSKPIGELATRMDILLPNGAEKSAGLRKLLEAKDCLVRASLPVKG